MQTSNTINHEERPSSQLALAAPGVMVPSGATRHSSCIRPLPAIAMTSTTSDLTREVGSLYQLLGHGVAQVCRKANDSYRGQSR
jgi:hypothetical protein